MVCFHHTIISFGFALAFLELALATAINITHDDANTQALYSTISYIGSWSQRAATCNSTNSDQCADPLSQASNGTWSTSIYMKNTILTSVPPSVTFSFYGTAVYVNCVLILDVLLGIPHNTDILFILDGIVVRHLQRGGPVPASGGIMPITALSLQSLSLDNHTLQIQNGVDDGNNTPKVSTLTLDSIIYTTDDNPNAFNTTSNVFLAPKQQEKKRRILEAAVTSGLAGVGFISLSFWLCIRRKQHKPLLPSLPTVFRHQPTSRPRTITPYSKRSSSLHPSQFERRGDGDDDARSFLSIVPPSYHSRLSNIP
ncbi:hypothetical protein EYR40_004452 [Pleurotus pulmonarius]|nr:hypothetical protein EYR40_004452 [Pleurotus pulmonarius]KAF4607150.1 hypothetical protein EYR38_001209 [Pleurotus pulmonarius]